MKRFPAILCFPIVCFATGAFVQAQAPVPPARERGPAPGEGFLSRLQDLRTKLDLSEEQTSRIRALLEEDAAKARELRADSSLSAEQKRQKARELFAGARQKMEPLLSAEQKQRLAEVFTPASPRDSGAPLSEEEWMMRLKEKLSLSEEQVGKIRPVLEQEVPKLRELARNRDTTPEARREAFGAALAQ